MKILFTNKIVLLAGVLCLLISCKKNAVDPAFTVTTGSNSYSFDSLFAFVDTSSAPLNNYFINIGAKDTKTNNLVYIAGFTSTTKKDFTGTYYYATPLPYPLPFPYKGFTQATVLLKGGQNAGTYALGGGSNISTIVINSANNYILEGNFSATLNPLLTNGSVNTSQNIQMTGHFNIPYHFIP
jgi:hypothetical protein